MMTLEESLEREYIDRVIKTREQLLEQINKKREFFKNIILEDESKKGYYETLDKLFADLYDQIDTSELFDAPVGMWHYLIYYDCHGIKVLLQKEAFVTTDVFFPEDFDSYIHLWNKITSFVETIDSYKMFEVPAKLLTVEEYAERYGVKLVTVRQWIRRGKIRSAVKFGSEWRIPELAPTPNIERGYIRAGYCWEDELTDIPEGFEYINNYRWLTITHKNSKEYALEFGNTGNRNYEILVNEATKEKFELYLIANPSIKNRDQGHAIEYI